MPERIAASGTVHWIGAGRSTGSGLRTVCDRAARVLLWTRTVDRGEDRLAGLGLTGRATARAFDLPSLAAELAPGDIVVSMLPAADHAALLRLCIDRRAHFACSSYVSEDILAEAPAAHAAGVVVLTEAGLDPGIDHLLAHRLVAQAQTAVGEAAAAADFTSYCGGVPAVPNEFRYRFSWAPRGVLTALRAPARYVEDGAERTVPRPWEATRRHVLGGETFEVYPNRDSLPFVAQYGIPPQWRLRTFVRGTLRLDGWREAWAPVFAELGTGDPARIDALADELAARYPTTDADRDRVVLAVALRVQSADAGAWSGEYLLDVVGDETESAMARCVSLPLSFGVAEILAGTTPVGLRRAAEDADEAARWIAFLQDHRISCGFTEVSGTQREGVVS
jgi:hypothetical protein